MQKRKLWEEWECDILRSNYGIITTKELQKLLPHRNLSSFKTKARTLGLKYNRRIHTVKYSVNTEIFNQPNTINSYWAGYIAADGCLLENDKFKLSCSVKDIEILENFKLWSNSTYPIHIYKIKPVIQDNKTYYCKDYAEIRATGVSNWHECLKQHWNITRNKSLILQSPNITDMKQIVAYIIGYIDGDGACFNCKRLNDHMFHLTICGTFNMMQWIIDNIRIICPDLKFKGSITLNGKSKTNYKIWWSATLAKKIHSTLKTYVDIPFRLKRKWEIEYA